MSKVAHTHRVYPPEALEQWPEVPTCSHCGAPILWRKLEPHEKQWGWEPMNADGTSHHLTCQVFVEARSRFKTQGKVWHAKPTREAAQRSRHPLRKAPKMWSTQENT